MKKPTNILDAGAYVEPYTFESDSEAILFASYVEHLKYIERLEASIQKRKTQRIMETTTNPKIGQYVWDIYYGRKRKVHAVPAEDGKLGLYFIGQDHDPVFRNEFIFPIPKQSEKPKP